MDEISEQPDLLVTASIFAGLLGIFAALLVIFYINAGEIAEKADGVPTNEKPGRYFGSWDEVVLILPNQVAFPDAPAGSFSVEGNDIYLNGRIEAYFKKLATDQIRAILKNDPQANRRVLLAVHQGASRNEYWIETMAGDSGVQQLSILRFHPDCLHIISDAPTSAKLLENCRQKKSVLGTSE